MANSSRLGSTSDLSALIAFFLSLSSTVSCNYVYFSAIQDTRLKLAFGLWHHSWYFISIPLNGSYVFQGCIGYGTTAVDGTMKAARCFSILALIFGGVVFFSGCFQNNKRVGVRIEGVAYLVACLSQGLSLLLLKSPTICTDNQLIAQLQSEIDAKGSAQIDFDEKCYLSTGARTCIAAIVFWFMAALASCQTASALKKEKDGGASLREPLFSGGV